MQRLLFILGGILFIGSFAAHIWVRIKLRPQDDDEVYWEFEDQDPAYEQYNRWLQQTMVGGCFAVLLLFLAIAL